MTKIGPILILEDNSGYQELYKIAFEELNFVNKIVFFKDGQKILEYLSSSSEKPFIIFSDINVPKLNGLELKEKIDSNEVLKLKCIPFLFFSTTSSQSQIIKAYFKSAQGFFIKPDTYQKLVQRIKVIIDYWQECESPYEIG